MKKVYALELTAPDIRGSALVLPGNAPWEEDENKVIVVDAERKLYITPKLELTKWVTRALLTTSQEVAAAAGLSFKLTEAWKILEKVIYDRKLPEPSIKIIQIRVFDTAEELDREQ